ncbi:unnamed protein product [Sphacelaria rigidula]
MLHGRVTWTIAHDNFDALREAQREPLLRYLNTHASSLSALDHHMLPYHEVLQKTGCQCIKATVMRGILLHAGHVVRMHDERLPNNMHRVMVGGTRKASRPARRTLCHRKLLQLRNKRDIVDAGFPTCLRMVPNRRGRS